MVLILFWNILKIHSNKNVHKHRKNDLAILNTDIGLSLRSQYSFKTGLTFYKRELPCAF